MENENIMKQIKLEKITLNCGTGTEQPKLEKALMLLKIIADQKPIKTVSRKRIPAFGIRPNLPIGCKVTIRGKKAEELLKRLLATIGNKIHIKQINPGSFAFGIKEYIEVPGMDYHREIGIMGFEVAVTLTRAGFKIDEKKIKKGKVPVRNFISKEETSEFIQKNFNTIIDTEKRRKEEK